MYAQHALPQPPPTALQLTHRQRGFQFLLDLTVTYALPVQTREFPDQVINLTQTGSTEVTDFFEYDDLPAMVAAVHIYVKQHVAPQQRYTRSLPELLAAFAARLFTTTT